jgi:hypothetical protein
MPEEIVTRAKEIRESLAEMQRDGKIHDGEFNVMGVLITDSILSRDVAALRTARAGLRKIYGQRRGNVTDTGRILGLIDIVSCALRRVDQS